MSICFYNDDHMRSWAYIANIMFWGPNYRGWKKAYSREAWSGRSYKDVSNYANIVYLKLTLGLA